MKVLVTVSGEDFTRMTGRSAADDQFILFHSLSGHGMLVDDDLSPIEILPISLRECVEWLKAAASQSWRIESCTYEIEVFPCGCILETSYDYQPFEVEGWSKRDLCDEGTVKRRSKPILYPCDKHKNVTDLLKREWGDFRVAKRKFLSSKLLRRFWVDED